MDLTLPNQDTIDVTTYWPIMGLKEPIRRFWSKPIKNQPLGSTIFESNFSRLGKKKQKPKIYYYTFSNDNTLCYFKKKGDKPKGILKINDTMILKLSSFTIGSHKSLGILFTRYEKITHLIYTQENSNALFELWEMLTPICAMSNFDEMYHPIQLLGKGSFATVYKAKRLIDDQLFAAKIYYRESLNANQHKDKFVAMIKNEISVLRQVSHTGIAALHEVYQQSDKVVLITEYVQGPDLYQLLKRKKVIKERKACFLIQQLAMTLEKLHGRGFVHRDLKLENVLLQSFETYETKLVDFGFAEPINEHMLTSKAGTPGYIPPELYANLPYTSKGDIFSLGVLLFSLVGGYSPFKGRTYKQIMESNKKAQIIFDKPVWQYVSRPCQDMILAMCQPVPMQRPSATEILNSDWMKHHTLPQDNKLEISNYLMIQNIPQDDQDRGNNVPSFYQKSNVTLRSVALSRPWLEAFDEIDYELEMMEGQIYVDEEKVIQMQRAYHVLKPHK